MPVRKNPSSTYQSIYSVVRRIPRGRVASYGQVAAEAGLPNAARQVGYALHALPDGSAVPWTRVVNAQGAISLRNHHALTQRMLLAREGVRFNARERVELAQLEAPPPHGHDDDLPRALVLVGCLGAIGRAARSPAQGAEADNFGFLLAERTPLGGANAGVMYRYQRVDGVGVDLFVTPLPPSLDPCPGRPAPTARSRYSPPEFPRRRWWTPVHRIPPRLAGSATVAGSTGGELAGRGSLDGHPHAPVRTAPGSIPISLALSRAGDAGPGAWPAPGGRNRVCDAEPGRERAGGRAYHRPTIVPTA